ncbi:glycosyltransferase family 2 protein [Acinetobacter portensis]|uniref:glycosyltransferase family 2 protein n=1 Tax=Acinetobacter portensis TaxID=1839785 RepID=UPI0013D4FBC4|nr:glycosyltransferase family 2 protein [Acinetobacter portensis]
MKINCIAIITPLYNEEKNIRNFINHLKLQTNHNFHLYFINDGSTDSTLSLLKQILLTSSFKFTIINQKNQGAAIARLNGINQINEEYCLMVDADDLISNDMIDTILSTLNNFKNIDTIVPEVMIQNKDGSYNPLPCFDCSINVYTGFECLKNSIAGWKISGLMCTKKNIFLKSYNQYHQFNPEQKNYLNNDEIITRLNFLNSNNVYRISSIYYYQYNQNSTTKNINMNSCFLINNAIILHKLLCHLSITDKLDKELISTIWGNKKVFQKNFNTIKNKKDWLNSITIGYKFIKNSSIINRLNFKNKIRLFRLFLFIIFSTIRLKTFK